jgi:hypothetical protein
MLALVVLSIEWSTSLLHDIGVDGIDGESIGDTWHDFGNLSTNGCLNTATWLPAIAYIYYLI